MSDSECNTPLDLKRYHYILLEVGLIASLLIFTTAMKIDFSSPSPAIKPAAPKDIIHIEQAIPTTQTKIPAQPPTPKVPIEVPNNSVIEAQNIKDINTDFGKDISFPSPDHQDGPAETLFRRVEQMPKMKGGQKWLYKHLSYPRLAKSAGIEGRIIIEFTVTKTGTVKNIKVLRGIGGGCDKAAKKVIKKAHFTPGLQRGVPVEVRYSIPIIFKLKK